MSGALKLTAYFPERERSDRRFLAESMLDLFAQRRVATSVMLRGISGFGHGHVLNTDRSLTLSEDPSLAVVAVDEADTIRSVAEEIAGMTSKGLITLEQAGWLGEEITPGDTVKLTVYLGRNRRHGGTPTYKVVCDLLYRNGFIGASAFLGVDGTVRGERRRAHFIGRNVDVPLMLIAIGSADRVAATTADLLSVLDRPLATVEKVRLGGPPALPDTDTDGRQLWQKLMVFTSEADRHDGVPVHRALVRRLWESGAASGATVLRGIWGYHGSHAPHGDKLFQLGRQVPVLTVIIDTAQGIARSFAIVDEVAGRDALVTCETVPALLAGS